MRRPKKQLSQNRNALSPCVSAITATSAAINANPGLGTEAAAAEEGGWAVLVTTDEVKNCSVRDQTNSWTQSLQRRSILDLTQGQARFKLSYRESGPRMLLHRVVACSPRMSATVDRQQVCCIYVCTLQIMYVGEGAGA